MNDFTQIRESQTEYEGLQLIARTPRPFRIGERAAHFDTLMGNLIDVISDPSRARRRDPDVSNRMRQDLQILGTLQLRQLYTAQLNRTWEAAKPETPESRAVAALFERLHDQQWRVTQSIRNRLDAILDGLTVQELLWTRNPDGTYGIKRAYPCFKDRFVFTKRGELCLKTRSDVYLGESVHPWQFVQHAYGTTGGSWSRPEDEGRLYWGEGEESHLYPSYYAKTVVFSLACKFLQRRAGGVFKGKFPARNKEAGNVMMSIVEAYQNDEELIIPSDEQFDVEIMQSAGGEGQVFMDWMEYFDKQIAKCLHGSTLTTDQGGGGSYALGDVHKDNFTAICDFDATSDEETVNSQIVPAIGLLNGIPRELWPKMQYDRATRSDVPKTIEAFTKLQAMGFTVSAEMVTKATGFRSPRPGETILQAKQDAQGGMQAPGMAAGAGSPLAGVDMASPEGLQQFYAAVNRRDDHNRGIERYTATAFAGHAHECRVDRYGNGETDKGSDGHRHEIRGWQVMRDAAHNHSLALPARSLGALVGRLSGAAPERRVAYSFDESAHPRETEQS